MIKRKVLSAALVAIGIFIPLEFRATAQTSSPTTPQDQTSTPSTQSSLSKADQQFMTKAAQGGIAEVQLAQLALQNSSSDAVKDYAQRMINDHTQADNQLTALASQKGVTLSTSLDSKDQANYDKLSKLTGANFDKAYIKAAGVNAHKQQASLFQHEAQKGQDPDVKAFAAQVLPTVQDHLQMAKALQSGSTAGSNMTQPSPSTSITQPTQPTQPLPDTTSSPVPSLSPSTGP